MDLETEDDGAAVDAHPPSPGDGGRFRTSAWERALNLVLVAAFLGITALARWIEPDPAGLGSHIQLGFPPCGLYQHTGIPCLSCGMTTAFAHMVRLELWAGVRASPFGAFLYVLGFLGTVLNLHAAATGWSFFRLLERLNWLWAGGGLVLGALASWAYKVIQAGS